MQSPITIHKLPKLLKGSENDTSAIALAQRAREQRLHALQSAQEAFASSYYVESQYGLDRTFERLSNPKAVNFVAAQVNDADAIDARSDSLTALLSREWVGFIALLGPSEYAAKITAKRDPLAQMRAAGLSNDLVRVGGQPATERPAGSEFLHYHMGAMFVDARARRSGLGKALIDAALAEAENQARILKAAAFECTLHADNYNVTAIKLYEKAGFVVVGEETYEQQSVTSGAKSKRVAVLMELRRAMNQT